MSLVGQIVEEFAEYAHIAEVCAGLLGEGGGIAGKLRRGGQDALEEVPRVGLAGPLRVVDDDLELALQIAELVLGQQDGDRNGADGLSGAEGVKIRVGNP